MLGASAWDDTGQNVHLHQHHGWHQPRVLQDDQVSAAPGRPARSASTPRSRATHAVVRVAAVQPSRRTGRHGIDLRGCCLHHGLPYPLTYWLHVWLLLRLLLHLLLLLPVQQEEEGAREADEPLRPVANIWQLSSTRLICHTAGRGAAALGVAEPRPGV